jgi:hypothetical protein
VLWGDEAIVRERLAGGTSAIRTTPREIELDYPFAPNEVVQFFRTYFGPVQMTFSRLNAQQQTEYAAELEKLWREHNEATGDRTMIRAEYLEVIATRA